MSLSISPYPLRFGSRGGGGVTPANDNALLLESGDLLLLESGGSLLLE